MMHPALHDLLSRITIENEVARKAAIAGWWRRWVDDFHFPASVDLDHYGILTDAERKNLDEIIQRKAGVEFGKAVIERPGAFEVEEQAKDYRATLFGRQAMTQVRIWTFNLLRAEPKS